MSWVLFGVLVYVAAQLAVGFVIARRVHTETDYLVAGRSLGLPLSAFTIFATWFGAETCIGTTARAYASGISGVTADPFGYALCLALMGLFFAAPLWNRKLTTLADLFRERFGSAAERVVVLLLVPTSVMWAGAQIRAFGQVLGASSAFSLTTAITIAAAVVIVYTAMGGMLADAISDLVQGIVLLLGMVLLLLLMVRTGDVQAALSAPSAVALEPTSLGALDRVELWTVPVLGSLVAQELVGRVVSARSARVARRGALIAALLYLAVGLIPVTIGMVAARTVPGALEPEQVLVVQAGRYMPGLLQIVFLGALVSAILSTVDSALLAAGSLTAHNLLLPLLGARSERRKIAINRGAVAAFGLLAYGLALSARGVYELVESASALGTAGVFVCVAFGLFTPWGRSVAALTSLTLGFALYAAGEFLLDWRHPYVVSLAGAAVGYLVAGALERG